MSRLLITSDLHLGHKNICKYRSQFSSEEEHSNTLYENLISNVKKADTIYFLGDIAFDKFWLNKIKEITCKHKKLICGNHDRDFHTMKELCDAFDSVDCLLSKRNVWFSHCPIHPQEMRKKVLNIHGHCVGEDTEILTKDGWKHHTEVKTGTKIYSLNMDSGEIVDDIVKVVLCHKYTGDMVKIKSKLMDLEFTDEHRVIVKDHKGKFKAVLAKDLTGSQLVLPVAGFYGGTGTGLSEEMLALYISIAADGSLANKDLVRFLVAKDRKLIYFKGLLEKLSIEYTQGENKSGKWLHFKLPDDLKGLRIKGLDRILTNATPRECEIVRGAYRNTDGNLDTIFTSKKEEVDILSEMFTINGYRAKIFSRDGHGFSTKTSYQLSVTKGGQRVISRLSSKLSTAREQDKVVWCPVTEQTTWIARTKGLIYITGNCHGSVIERVVYGSASEVEADQRYFNACVEHTNYKPISFAEIMERTNCIN